MADTLGLEITIWVFFAISIAICAKANKEGTEWLKIISGVISIILAILAVMITLINFVK